MAAYDALVYISLSFLVGTLAISGSLIVAAAYKFLVCGCGKKR